MIKDLQPSELDSVPNVFWLTPADALDRFAGKYNKSVKYFYKPYKRDNFAKFLFSKGTKAIKFGDGI